ncbi:MAG: DedA family protein [Alloprevotella sp.]|nr:DedA family protein [Alloprevotella sp.]
MSSAVLIQWILAHLNYWVVLLFMAVESSFIPFPSEVIVPPAAWKSMSDPSMVLPLVVVFATLGADIGALVNYYLSRWLGRPLVYRFANSRFGHLCLIDEEAVRKAETYFVRHGATATLIGRFVPAVRQLISIPAGLSGMPIGRFLLYTTIGAAGWNTILAAIGWGIYRFTDLKTVDDVVTLATTYSHELGYCILAIVALAVFFVYLKSRRRKSGSSDEMD